MEPRKALGKGLGSLIPLGNREREDGGRVYFECPIEDIIPNPLQPRKLFPKEELDELAASIESKGVLQPLIVRSLGGGKYELVAGERRYRASKLAGLSRVPVIIKETDESGTLELGLIENIQRQDLNPIEESLAYKELLSRHQYTQDELAKQVGKDRSSIANSLRLLKLPDKIRDYLISNQISMGHARAILSVDNKELQLQIAEDVIKNNLSVRDVEAMTQNIKEQGETATQDVVGEIKKPRTEEKFITLTKKLQEHLRRKVAIKVKGEKGKMVIHFHSTHELNELANKLLS